MAKSRVKKQSELEHANERFRRSKATVVVSQQGVTVKAIEKLRNELRANDSELQGVKKTLLNIFAKENDLDLSSLTSAGTTGLVFSYGDEVSAAKALLAFGKEYEGLQMVGGILEQRILSREEVIALAKIPGKQQLLGQLVGVMNAPVAGFVRVLAGPVRGLATVLQRISEQKV